MRLELRFLPLLHGVSMSDLKQVYLPTEAHENIQSARKKLSEANIKASMSELWIEASQYALGAAVNKILTKEIENESD